MVKECLNGLMVGNIKANMKMIRNKDMDNFIGLMVDHIEESG